MKVPGTHETSRRQTQEQASELLFAEVLFGLALRARVMMVVFAEFCSHSGPWTCLDWADRRAPGCWRPIFGA
jgi:hypothetical protein